MSIKDFTDEWTHFCDSEERKNSGQQIKFPEDDVILGEWEKKLRVFYAQRAETLNRLHPEKSVTVFFKTAEAETGIVNGSIIKFDKEDETVLHSLGVKIPLKSIFEIKFPDLY